MLIILAIVLWISNFAIVKSQKPGIHTDIVTYDEVNDERKIIVFGRGTSLEKFTFAIQVELDDGSTRKRKRIRCSLESRQDFGGKYNCNVPALPKNAEYLEVCFFDQSSDIAIARMTCTHRITVKNIQGMSKTEDGPSEFDVQYTPDGIEIEAVDGLIIGTVDVSLQYFQLLGPPGNIGQRSWKTMATLKHDFARRKFTHNERDKLGNIWRIAITNNDGSHWHSEPQLKRGKFLFINKEPTPPHFDDNGGYQASTLKTTYTYSWGETVDPLAYQTEDDIQTANNLAFISKVKDIYETDEQLGGGQWTEVK